jgi:hypothetical protein
MIAIAAGTQRAETSETSAPSEGMPERAGGIAPMIRHLRQWLAIYKLNKLVSRQRNSFEIIDYRRRREAALKHTRAT